MCSRADLVAGQAFFAAVFFTAALAGAVFFTAVFFTAVFFTAALAGAVLTAVFLTALLAGAVFFTAVFFTAAFFTAAFFTAAFFTAAFFTAVFLAATFLAGTAFFTVAFFTAVLLEAALVVAEARAPAAELLGSCLGSATTARNCVPALNFGTAVFLILTLAPVRGLRPIRAARATFSKVPKPVMPTFSPLATVRMMMSRTSWTAEAAAFLPPRRLSRASISSPLFTSSPPEEKVHRAHARRIWAAGPPPDLFTTLRPQPPGVHHPAILESLCRT